LTIDRDLASIKIKVYESEEFRPQPREVQDGGQANLRCLLAYVELGLEDLVRGASVNRVNKLARYEELIPSHLRGILEQDLKAHSGKPRGQYYDVDTLKARNGIYALNIVPANSRAFSGEIFIA
jgi:hypothetical protein